MVDIIFNVNGFLFYYLIKVYLPSYFVRLFNYHEDVTWLTRRRKFVGLINVSSFVTS